MLFLYFYHMNTYFYAGFRFFCIFMFYHHWNNYVFWKYSKSKQVSFKAAKHLNWE